MAITILSFLQYKIKFRFSFKMFVFITIFLVSGVIISTKKFTYIKTEIQPVYEWEITAELIAYDAERNRKVTEKPDQFTLEVRSYTIDKIDKKLTLDTQHELRIDSVVVNYANLAKTFTGHSSYEDNKTNDTLQKMEKILGV